MSKRQDCAERSRNEHLVEIQNRIQGTCESRSAGARYPGWNHSGELCRYHDGRRAFHRRTCGRRFRQFPVCGGYGDDDRLRGGHDSACRRAFRTRRLFGRGQDAEGRASGQRLSGLGVHRHHGVPLFFPRLFRTARGASADSKAVLPYGALQPGADVGLQHFPTDIQRA